MVLLGNILTITGGFPVLTIIIKNNVSTLGFKVNSYHFKEAGRKRLVGKKRGFKQDPVVVLTYFVLLGVLLSGFASFGL